MALHSDQFMTQQYLTLDKSLWKVSKKLYAALGHAVTVIECKLYLCLALFINEILHHPFLGINKLTIRPALQMLSLHQAGRVIGRVPLWLNADHNCTTKHQPRLLTHK